MVKNPFLDFEFFTSNIPCDSSPPLEPITGESSNVHKISYIHPNLIMLVAMGSRRQEEEMSKNPF